MQGLYHQQYPYTYFNYQSRLYFCTWSPGFSIRIFLGVQLDGAADRGWSLGELVQSVAYKERLGGLKGYNIKPPFGYCKYTSPLLVPLTRRCKLACKVVSPFEGS